MRSTSKEQGAVARVLLEITVAQVFLYTSEQLAATASLAVLLLLWGIIRWGIHLEIAERAARVIAPASAM